MSYARAFAPTLEDETDGRVGSPRCTALTCYTYVRDP
jgi:hypothetical protein